MAWRQITISTTALVISVIWFLNSGYHFLSALLFGLITSYLPLYFNGCEKKDGLIWPYFQKLKFWKKIADYNKGTVSIEKSLNHHQQYIFCCFPHGACNGSVNHVLTMTDACGMISRIYMGDRRDLVASILFIIPILREFLLFLGCVDASPSTARYNLKKGRSLLIYIGGEKEQLMTAPGESKIYLRNRKGFIKLALVHGIHLIPMYAFGENETYSISTWFMDIRVWLQDHLKLGIPLAWGPLTMLPLIPHPVPLNLEIGAPIPVKMKPEGAIIQKDIDELHDKFLKEMSRLFDRTKHKYPGFENAELKIL